MAPKLPLLEQMRRNPRADWTIDDVARVCADHHIELEPPSGGSHYKAISPLLSGHLTVVARKPIKAFYIKALVSMIDGHLIVLDQNEGR